MNFPVFKTKIPGKTKKFDLTDPIEVQKYFKYKAGEEIAKIDKFLEKNTFVTYFLGKKGAGKGTYSNLFTVVFGEDKIGHISVGDVVREVDLEMKEPEKKRQLVKFLEKNYRGYYSLEEILQSQEERSTTKPLLPTEYIMALLKRKIGGMPRKALFIDGLPRNLDQVSYSLFFRELIGYRDDPDMFALIDIPETVIDARIKTRLVCPKCAKSRNTKLLLTSIVGYDEKTGQFYLCCDNPKCKQVRMLPKEGDELGIEPIRGRLTADGQLIEQAFHLYGVPKILLRNSVPAENATRMVDEYEITPEYVLEHIGGGKVKISTKPWVIKDDEGVDSYSLLAEPVALGMIKQIAEILDL